MVIDRFDVVCVTGMPTKADAPLIIDADAVLACSVSLEFLEAVARWHSQVLELIGRVHQAQLAQHESVQLCREASNGFAAKESLRVPIGEALDHRE